MDPEIYKEFFTNDFDGQTCDLLAGQNPLDEAATGRWYGLREVDGEVKGAAVREIDAYIRANSEGLRFKGFVMVDGLMAGLLARGLGHSHLDLLISVFGPMERWIHAADFKGIWAAMIARWYEIYCGLLRSPRPKVVGDALEVGERLPSTPEAYFPLLAVDDGELNPEEWILGFRQALAHEEDEWRPLIGTDTEQGLARSLRFFMSAIEAQIVKVACSESWDIYAGSIQADVIICYDWFRRTGRYEFMREKFGEVYH